MSRGVGNVAVLNQALAIRTDVENVEREGRAAVARELTRVFGSVRPTVVAKAEEIAGAAIDGVVETLDWRHPAKAWVSSGSYIDFGAEANHIFPWEKGTADNQAKQGQYDLIQWAGFAINPDIQLATLREIIEKGVVEIHWGDAQTPIREVPLERFLFTRIGRFAAQGALASGAAALEEHIDLRNTGQGFSFDRNRLMVVVPGDRSPKLLVKGLSGSVAGSSPALAVQHCFRGVRIRR